MEFTVKRSSLLDELSLVSSVVDKKPLITSQGYILMTVEKGFLHLMAVGKDISLRCSCRVMNEKEGSIAIPPRKLSDIIRLLPEADISFSTTGESRLDIRHEKAHFRITGLPREQFTEPNILSDYSMKLPADVLKEMIQRTIFAVSQQENERFVLGGAQLEIRNRSLRMVTSDAHRLVLVEKKEAIPEPDPDREMKFIVPQRSLNELSRIIDQQEFVELGRDDRHVYFRAGERELISGLIAGTFPNYETIIPRDNHLVMTANAGLFMDSLRRSSVLAEETDNEKRTMRKVRFRLSPGLLEMRASSVDYGESEESLEVEYDGPRIETEFNAPYIVDFLTVIKTDRVSISFKDDENPVLLQPQGEDVVDYRCVLAVISTKESKVS